MLLLYNSHYTENWCLLKLWTLKLWVRHFQNYSIARNIKITLTHSGIAILQHSHFLFWKKLSTSSLLHSSLCSKGLIILNWTKFQQSLIKWCIWCIPPLYPKLSCSGWHTRVTFFRMKFANLLKVALLVRLLFSGF